MARKPTKPPKPAKSKRPSDIERFRAKVSLRADGCHIWKGKPDKGGFGRFRAGGRVRQAHVWIYEQVRGPLEPGHELKQTCGEGLCVHLAHLQPMTRQEKADQRKLAEAEAEELEEVEPSERTKQRTKKKEGEEKAAAAAVHLAPLKTAIWFALLGETDRAAEQAAKIATAGRKRDDRASDAELAELAELARSDDYEDARAGTNAYNARLAQYAIMLWLVRAIETVDQAAAGQVPFGIRQLQQVQVGFGGSLAGFKKVELDLEKLLGGVAGDVDVMIDLRALHAEVYGSRKEPVGG